jgi:hypothetical protein
MIRINPLALSLQSNDNVAIMTTTPTALVSMFIQVQSLPGSQGQATIADLQNTNKSLESQKDHRVERNNKPSTNALLTGIFKLGPINEACRGQKTNALKL